MIKVLSASATFLIPFAASAQDAAEFSYGATIASDYISDGESISGNKPVLQGYVELQKGRFYVSAWASTLDDGTDHLESDLTVGFRTAIDDLELDFSYARTVYDNSGDCCGEFALSGEYLISDEFYVGAGLSHDPNGEETSAELASGYDFTENWGVSAAIGADFDASEDDEDSVSWDIGLIRSIGENAWGDVRFFDSTIESSHVIVSLGFDF